MKGTWRIFLGLLLLWLIVMIYMSSTLYQSSDIAERTERQLTKALQELDALKKQNEELQDLALKLKDIRLAAAKGAGGVDNELQQKLDEANAKVEKMLHEQAQTSKPGLSPVATLSHIYEPDLLHESSRRNVENGVKEMNYYLQSQLGQVLSLVKDNSAAASKLNLMMKHSTEREHSLLTDIYNLTISNNMEQWRKQEAQELSDIVQHRIHYLQNPPNCKTAKKLLCNLNKGCGYGCQIHHLLYCFFIAYGTKRTLILNSHGWKYSPRAGWEGVYMPLSDTCTQIYDVTPKSWGAPSAVEAAQVVELPIVDSLSPRPQYMPLNIPKDLSRRLIKMHSHPIAWFMGQFLKYALKPGAVLAKEIQKSSDTLQFQRPIVGVHVRRTDKVGTEAAFHAIEEYMVKVDKYYDLYERRHKVEKRRVYLATDEPHLLAEAREKYPNYLFLSDNDASRSAGLGTRYTEESLFGIILDIYFLSKTDHLVCTFSSQVCRVAYEMMQAYHPDAGYRFTSLDDIYYFGGQNEHNQVAVMEHQAETNQEISFQVGDLIGVAGNHWDGYSKGQNKRTHKMGLYPSYKVVEHIDIFQFPTYPEANQER